MGKEEKSWYFPCPLCGHKCLIIGHWHEGAVNMTLDMRCGYCGHQFVVATRNPVAMERMWK